MDITVDIPKVESVHVGCFYWTHGSVSYGAKFCVRIPPATEHWSSRSWRENLLNIQFMMAWQDLIEKGCRDIRYKSLHPHPIF